MSLYYDQDNYDLSSNNETEDLLAELPFDLIKESILEQIQDPMSTRINYVDVIVDKCEMYKEEYSEDETVIVEINNHLNEFFISIMQAIDNKFNLGLNMEEISSYSNVSEIGHCIYKYFIISYMKNITKFITKFIFKNKKSLYNYYEDKMKKDVSTLAFKKQFKNPEDLCIITNLPSIMKYIIGLDIDSLEFINLSTGIDNYEASVIRELIENGNLVGDFYSSYIGLCVDSHDYIMDEIQTEIRIKIINKISK